MGPKKRLTAFTLIELLTVIGIIAILAGLLLPVYFAARGKAYEIGCISNLRQIGMAIQMYTDDSDGLYPWAVDPTDRYTPQIWSGYPQFQQEIPNMPMLQDVLQSYIRNRQIFDCPADSGYQVEDFTDVPLNAEPSSFQAFGTSYNYRTEIAFRHAGDATFAHPSDLNVLMDASGRWHGGLILDQFRYDVLFADQHVKSLSRSQLEYLWSLPL